MKSLVPRDRGSGTLERNEVVREYQTAGKRSAKRAKVRSHSPQEAPKVAESERSRKRCPNVMTELQSRVTREEECQECRQRGWELHQPLPFPAETLEELDTWLSSLQGRGSPANWAREAQTCGDRQTKLTLCPDPVLMGTGLAVAQHDLCCRWPAGAMLFWIQGSSSHCRDAAAPDRHRGGILGHR